MATFTFVSEGITAGFGESGFFAFGETSDFQFDEREWPGHGLPHLQSDKLAWSIQTTGRDAWESYTEVIEAYGFDRANWPMTERAAEIERIFSKPRLGLFIRWKPGETTLTVFLKNDPALAIVIMGAIAAGREIDFFQQGFLFADEGKPGAAAPTVSGWSDRKEPLILTDHPIIRVK
ncbi:hypothetical protein [Brevundimonas sp.]